MQLPWELAQHVVPSRHQGCLQVKQHLEMGWTPKPKDQGGEFASTVWGISGIRETA